MMTTPVREVTTQPARAASSGVVAGVDTHQDTHHVAVLAASGARLGDLKVRATPAGYQQLLSFVASFGSIVPLIGIGGTNSYGAGLARFLTGASVPIREVIRPKRVQRRRGKSDPIDAYAAAQQALAEPDTLPIAKAADGHVEQIRVLLAVRRSAMKARVAAARQIKSLLITAPEPIRTRWGVLDGDTLIDTLAATRPGPPPALIATTGYGVVTGATLLITAGDNPDRLRSEAAFAALCGAAPIPASSGKTNRHRLNRGGDWSGGLISDWWPIG